MSNSAQDSATAVNAAIEVEAMSLASGVMETIVRIAASEVEGVVDVCAPQARGTRKLFAPKPVAPGVEVTMDENGKATIALHLTVSYGQVLPELAAQVREAVAQALVSQVGVGVNRIDVYIDNIAFN